jgi:hypothetical protein
MSRLRWSKRGTSRAYIDQFRRHPETWCQSIPIIFCHDFRNVRRASHRIAREDGAYNLYAAETLQA